MTDKKKNSSSVKKLSAKKAKPAKQNEEKLPSGGQNVGSGFTRSLGGDRSLQAYKDWIKGIILSLNPNAEDTMTEEEWVKRWKEFWSKADSASATKRANGISVDGASETKKTYKSMEEQYPGITEQLNYFKQAELPSCSHCGSVDTARVQVGVIGRTIYLAGATKKFKLIPNGPKPGKYFCNACKKFFD